jgi:thymidylate kinase
LKTLLRKTSNGQLPPADPFKERIQKFESKTTHHIWLIFAIFDLFLNYCVWLRWLNLRRYIALCDRYIEDTLLDFYRNFPKDYADKWLIWRYLCLIIPKPDLRFLLLIPPDESLRRTGAWLQSRH